MLLLLACTSAPPATSPDTGRAVGFGQADELEPGWGIHEVEDAVTEAISGGFPDPIFLQQLYLGLMSYGDAECPGDPLQITDTYLEGCMADSGYWYAGVTTWDVSPHEDDAVVSEQTNLGADFEIITNDGDRLRVGGHANYGWSKEKESDNTTWSGAVTGSWSFDNEGGWLERGASGWLELAGGSVEGEDWLVIHGPLGLAAQDLYFDNVNWHGECQVHPRGELRVRGPEGLWYVLVLDEGCTGCGGLSVRGEHLGQACVDLAGVGGALRDNLGVQ